MTGGWKMLEWEIDWRAEDAMWWIGHRPTKDLLIHAGFNADCDQRPIYVYRCGNIIASHPWPWSHNVSPELDAVLAELRRIAAEYLEVAT